MKDRRGAKLKGHVYFVRGMYCPSCEILIEKRLLKEKGIEAVEASTNKSQVRIEYFGQKPSTEKLDKIFQKKKYTFSNKPIKASANSSLLQFNKQGQLIVNKRKLANFLTVAGASLIMIIAFILLNNSGFAALVSVNSQSALPAFLIFGLLAGFSSCSALVGGIILSMSKQWSNLYPKETSSWQRFQPHLLFNSGRLISYLFLGVVLGALGSALQISLVSTSILTIVVSVVMFFSALQMLGVKALQKFQFTMPKFITRFVADETNFKGKWMPFLMGTLTFFLPCGFTITAQGLALTSGNPLQAGMIMFFFALGTLPALVLIGISSVKFNQKPHFAGLFLKVAGVLVLFFGLYNINAQLNVLGLSSFSDLSLSSGSSISEDGFSPIVNGKQILKMDALAYGYEPNKFKVRVGVPVRWEITDQGTSGCTNAVISRGLFDGEIRLSPGTISVKEFTPQKVGRYKFSCWMGMVSGAIEVADQDGSISSNGEIGIIDSGAQGCGGGGCSGGCGGGCGNPDCSYAK